MMDPRITLEKLDDLYYIVYEVATGLEIGGVIKRYGIPPPDFEWCAMTPENAAHDVFSGPTEGAAATKEEAAAYLLPLLREPNIEGRPGDEYEVSRIGDECYVWNSTTNTSLSGALAEDEANRRAEELSVNPHGS
jgi:hypothetical protein